MRDYYAEYLQIKNSVNTLPSEVSKVSKGQKSDANQAFDTFDTALPSANQKISVCKKTVEPAAPKADKFYLILNRLIEDGITFEVSADDFQIIDNAQILKNSDSEVLNLNAAAILCHLQQSLLMKYVFLQSPDLFADFALEIKKRESVLTETTRNVDSYNTAVIAITREWFELLLNTQ